MTAIDVDVNAQDVHPGARRMFGVKDLLTSLNALAGVAALALCAEGRWLWACYAVMAGYAVDMVDGRVARALREANRFGAEFDTARRLRHPGDRAGADRVPRLSRRGGDARVVAGRRAGARRTSSPGR